MIEEMNEPAIIITKTKYNDSLNLADSDSYIQLKFSSVCIKSFMILLFSNR